VPVKTDAVDGGWHHVQHVRPFSTAGGARMYVDGIAVGFVAGNYTITDDADLVIGSNTGGTAISFTGGTAEFFSGVVDNLTMHAFGTTTLGTVHGQFNLAVDNEFVANALQGKTIGDLTGDNIVLGDGLSGSGEPDADDDVLAFIDSWRFSKTVNGRLLGDLETFENGDFNFDGIVNWSDWHTLRTAHSGGAGAISEAAFARLAAAPEPASLALMVCGGIVVGGWRCARCNRPNSCDH